MSALRKGWCPGALRPMRSGDGLIVRLRPSCGELSAVAAREIATLSSSHGNGEIDLTARGHLQLRGVLDERHADLIERLTALGLIDASPQVEAVRNVLVTPFAGLVDGLDMRPLARAWEGALAQTPALWRLPGKFGVAFDAGPLALGDDSDIRFEALDPTNIVARLAGAEAALGPFNPHDLVRVAQNLALAFLATDDAPRRMRDAVRARGLAPFASASSLPICADPPPPPATPAHWLGPQTFGLGVAAPFGRLAAADLAALADASANGLRLTPWRGVLLPGLADGRALAQAAPNLVFNPADPLLRVAACAGAPACSSALGETREAARRLAPLAPRGEGIWLHVSGCAKGCAHPRPAPLNVVATPQGYQLNGEAARSLEALAQRIG